jgi:hypothetical protein
MPRDRAGLSGAPGVRRGKADALDAGRIVHVTEQVRERPLSPACARARVGLNIMSPKPGMLALA